MSGNSYLKHITLYYAIKENQIKLIAFWNNRQRPLNPYDL